MAVRLRRRQPQLPSFKPSGRHRRAADVVTNYDGEIVKMIDIPDRTEPVSLSSELFSDPTSAILSPLAQIGVVRGALCYLLDQQMTVTSVSGDWQTADLALPLLEQVRAQVLGTQFLDHVPDTDRARWEAVCCQFLAEGQLSDGRLEYSELVTWPSLPSTLKLSIMPLFGQNSVVQGLTVLISDVTRQLRDESQSRRQSSELALLYSIGSAMSGDSPIDSLLSVALKSILQAVDADRGAVYLYDEQASRLKSTQPAIVAGSWPKRWPRSWQETLQTALRHSIHMGTAVVSPPLENSGKPPLHLLSLPLVAELQRVGAIVVLCSSQSTLTSDLLPMLTAAGAQIGGAIERTLLFERSRQQETELRQQIQRLEQVYTNLQETLQEQTRFMDDLAHDLRSSLGTVQGYTELALSGTFGKLADPVYDAFQVIADQSANLGEAAGSLALIEELERSSPDIELIEVSDLLAASVRSRTERALRKGVSVSLAIEKNLPALRVDAEQITQVVERLLDSALKTSSEGSSIQVTVQRSSDQPDKALVGITAYRAGVTAPPAAENFTHSAAATGPCAYPMGCTSLSLALVKRIVESHGCQIWTTVQTDEGSGLYFTLPFAALSAQPV